MLARLWGFRGRAAKSRADELLAAFDLADAGHKQVRDYSGGMRRRLDIAASLVVTPGVLFLDEPTTGLDPKARKAVWRMIRGLADAGVTILLTTQYLEEADQLAARIAVQTSVEGAQLSVKAGSAQTANEAIAALIEAGIEPSDFSMGQPSLDEVFFALTGQGVESDMMVEDNR
jgi:ABC-2 type transport system ATP-binding protein